MSNNTPHECFFVEIEDKLKEEGTSRALDYIFTTLDRLLLQGYYPIVDDVLSHVDPCRFSMPILIGILTMTYSCKDYLLHRESLLSRCKQQALRAYSDSEVSEMFLNL